MGISLVKAELLALFLETFVYGMSFRLVASTSPLTVVKGIFFTLSLITFTILSSARLGRTHSRTIILPTAFIMLALATAVSACSFYRILCLANN